MRAREDPSRPDVESTGVGLLGIVSLFLLVFALVFLVWYPTQEKPSFSEMKWVDSPSFRVDGNTSWLEFGVIVHSFERDTVSYHASVYLENRFVAFRDFELRPSESIPLSFSLPVDLENGIEGSRHEVSVSVSRKAVGSDSNALRPILELVDWAVFKVE